MKNIFHFSIKIKKLNLRNNNNIISNNNEEINNFNTNVNNNIVNYGKMISGRQSPSKLFLKMNIIDKNMNLPKMNINNNKNSKKSLPNDNENNFSSNETSHLSNPSQQNKQIILKTNQNKVQNNSSKDKKNKVINRKCSSRGESNVKVIVKNEKIIIDSALNRRGSISGQEKDKLKLIKLKKNIYKKNSVAPFLYEDKQN